MPTTLPANMPSVVVTTNEPSNVKDLFQDKGILCPMNFDFMLFTNSGKIGIERKAVPGDLLSSVTDGRLAREMAAMRDETQFQIVLLHGEISYHYDGVVDMGRNHAWTRSGVRNLIRTMQYVEGMYIEYAKDDQELLEVIAELQEYFDMLKSKHLGFKMRPHLQSNWNMSNRMEKVSHFYQGLPSVSGVRAKSLCHRFPSPMDLYSASLEDIQQISGFGRTLATRIYSFLRTGNE